MPLTPFHFGPAACLSLPFKNKLDAPVFILANVAVDLEPFAVIVFGLNYPLHGYAHSLAGGALVGLAFGAAAYALRAGTAGVMTKLRLDYQPGRFKAMLSGVLGVWFHVLLDSTLYGDIKPFYPSGVNPLLGALSYERLYLLCALSFLPALAIYFYRRQPAQTRETL